MRQAQACILLHFTELYYTYSSMSCPQPQTVPFLMNGGISHLSRSSQNQALLQAFYKRLLTEN